MAIIDYVSINLKAPPQNGLQGTGFSVAASSVAGVARIYRDTEDPGVFLIETRAFAGNSGGTPKPMSTIDVPASNVNGARRAIGPQGAAPKVAMTETDVMSEAEAIQEKQRARLAAKQSGEQSPKEDRAAKARAAKAAKAAAQKAERPLQEDYVYEETAP